MKVVFLDIDGVLNNDKTTEQVKIDGGNYTGLDARLVMMFRLWLDERPDVKVVLSSTWRKYKDAVQAIEAAPIPLWDMTRELKTMRGREVAMWLRDHVNEVDAWAILDDVDGFLTYQRSHWVKTDPRVGLSQSDLDELDVILGTSKSSGERSEGDASNEAEK